ncbi:XRE family transcriptional regulator [Amycolatopsis rhabdoformis]|uniref:XRE family transcriptional regulator n=1 Tax=Amycolatopsis rhabdoformis TaxID=1448059 RepID=A0ABZ1IID7_9PSEU|nr:XRE family transcriptional regulator [Amycolatopsis rhabdoformis]WSE34214.1 XRE family transcriptional regulator [Amycolatopsis rhabdoformis]
MARHEAAERPEAANLGSKLRARRQEVGVTLRQFARDLGYSAAFVSQIENGKSQPSVATLYAMCTALNVSIDELFSGTETAAAPAPPAPSAAGVERHSFHGALAKLNEEPEEHQRPLLRPGERRQLVLDSGVTWEQLSAIHDSTVDFLHVRYEVAGSSVPDDKLTRHSGIEYGYIISGTLEVALAFDTYELHAGDSIAFDSTTPHRLTNRGDQPAEAIWFVHGRKPAR